MSLPQIRLQPFYPGQMGVAGSDVQRGLRREPTAIVLYVDENHPGATAGADGTDPEHPLNSVQVAVDRLISFQTSMGVSLVGSHIVIGAGATIAESVVVPPTAPKGVTILGCSNGAYHPTWTPATDMGIALTLQQENWRVSGFHFHFSGNGTGVRLAWVDDPGAPNASGAVIDNNHFSGWWHGLYGVEFVGAPYNVLIANNEFNELQSTGAAGTAFGIVTSDSSEANAYECRIVNNVFWENENHIGSVGNDRSFNMSLFQGNVFHDGVLIATTRKLDLRGGTRGRNIVVGNVFCGTYSTAGGYYGNVGAPDNWVGNFAEDVASPQVGDNGLTIAPPV